MNLHNIIPSQDRWLWIRCYGGNGRTLGTHAWLCTPGEPPTEIEERPIWGGRFWMPRRYSWSPYYQAISLLFTGGWTRPLCGRTSRSRWPSASAAYSTYGCIFCERIANERGIMITTQANASAENLLLDQLTVERDAWLLENPQH